jgi:RNA polymerase sigma factor for flagellar operon FliA
MGTLNFFGRSSCSTADARQRFESGQLPWTGCDAVSRRAIVSHYAPKIKIIALRMKAKLPQHVELAELISAGSLGLIEALEKFRPDLGIKFETYAENRIKGAMLDELRRMDWFTRGLRQRVKMLEHSVRQIEQFTGHTPSIQDLQTLTGFSAKEVEQGLEALQNQVHISLEVIEESLLRTQDGQEGDPFSHVLKQELVDKLGQLIDELTPREQLVLSLYYVDELNMRETAMVMDITEGRVSQLHSQALAKLRKKFRKFIEDIQHFPVQKGD